MDLCAHRHPRQRQTSTSEACGLGPSNRQDFTPEPERWSLVYANRRDQEGACAPVQGGAMPALGCCGARTGILPFVPSRALQVLAPKRLQQPYHFGGGLDLLGLGYIRGFSFTFQ